MPVVVMIMFIMALMAAIMRRSSTVGINKLSRPDCAHYSTPMR